MKKSNGKKTVLIVILCVLLFVFGVVIGVLAAQLLTDAPLGPDNDNKVTVGDNIEGKTENEADGKPENDTVGINVAQAESDQEHPDIETKPESAPLQEPESETETETESETEEIEPIRIVLDPGHDDICSRNHPDLGFNEQDLNLKIALACREELETYKGVEVFMTREDGSCPDNGIGSDDVTGRTAYAESVNADLFVSLHNNATGLGYPSAANGAEVYITVYSKFTDDSRELAESILAELTTRVDLANRGVLTRIKESKGYYDDGNIQDWYYLISTSVERGFPGIIIEHSFMDNAHDNAILKDDEQLKAMGIADAIGIANYYGLEKKE